jgi:hypothetical protein
VLPDGAMSTEAALRASPRQHATLAAEPAGGLKPPWSNSAPTWRALGGRAVQRAEGPRDDFEYEYGTVRGCPDKPGSPPIAGESLFISPHSYTLRHRNVGRHAHAASAAHFLQSRKFLKGGKDKKRAHAGGRGRPAGLGRTVAPAAALAPPRRWALHSPPSYTLRHQNAGRHAPAAPSAYFKHPDKELAGVSRPTADGQSLPEPAPSQTCCVLSVCTPRNAACLVYVRPVKGKGA